MQFEGYASTTEHAYDMGWYFETIKRGAFTKTLRESPDVTLNINHGGATSGLPIARTSSGTLHLNEDSQGLRVVADLDDEDPDVALVARKMDRGDLDGQMSFAFMVVRQEWNSDYSERSICEVDLHNGDVSIVTAGANPATSSVLRRSSHPAKLSIADRRRAASVIAQGVTVVESRSFTLAGRRYDFREDASDVDQCNRCRGSGSITLQGNSVTCPQCGGDGGTSGNTANTDEAKSIPDYTERARLQIMRYDFGIKDEAKWRKQLKEDRKKLERFGK